MIARHTARPLPGLGLGQGRGSSPTPRLAPCHSSSSDPSSTSASALEAGQEIIDVLQRKQADELIAWLPDPLLDAVAQSEEATTLQETLRESTRIASSGQAPPFVWNSASGRIMQHDYCEDAQNTSQLLISLPPDDATCSKQRWSVRSVAGERLMLSMELRQTPSLSANYKSIELGTRWYLAAITGEPDMDGEHCPLWPNPSWGPEAVVTAQLEALRSQDFERVFSFASPRNKMSSGPLDKFEKMVQAPVFAALNNPEWSASPITWQQPSPSKFMQLISVTDGDQSGEDATAYVQGGVQQDAATRSPSKGLFLWVLSRQPDGVWLTDAVQPVADQYRQRR